MIACPSRQVKFVSVNINKKMIYKQQVKTPGIISFNYPKKEKMAFTGIKTHRLTNIK
jgi:hypothetical protein